MMNDPLILAYALFVAALLGLAMGSFINCWAWRYVQGESVLRGRSHCASCGHDLGVRDLVPIVSWVASGGKCRYCGEKVSARYPVTEAVCAIAFVAIVAAYGLSLETLELLVFACVLLFLSLVDIDTRIIPNGCIIVAIAVRIAYLAYAWATGLLVANDIVFYGISALAMGVVLLIVTIVADHVFKRPSMGGGDLKLYLVAGLYFGWIQGLFLVIVSCIIGILVAFLAPSGNARQDDSPEAEGEGVMKRTIPFGPSIAAACIATMLVGKQVISWYLALL